MAPTRRSGPNNNENPDIAAIIAQQLQTILPQIVAQVANQVNANGGNGGNGGNNGCSYKGFMTCNPKEYDGKGGAIALTRWIKKMENVIDNSGCFENQKNHKMVGANHAGYTDRFHELAKLVPHLITPESSRIKRYIVGLAPEILRAGILTDEAVSCSTLTKGNEKRKGVEETSKSGGSWKENKKAKVRTGFVATAPPRNEYVGPYLKWARFYSYHPEDVPCKVCYNYQKSGHFAKDCRAPYRQVDLVNAVRMGNNQRVCYECGSSDHLRNTFPKMNRAPGQAGNPLALKGNRNTRNNGNRAKGRAFNVNVNAVEALQDPNVVMGTFSLNDHFATVIFDSRADFSFISTEYAPLLNVKSSIVNPGYVIEVAYGKKVEVDRIIRDCKLELRNSLFSINLMSLGHGSFDVIVGSLLGCSRRFHTPD
ncbi:putative reverse transcriptase domain-containing protein [Tanacetum coccineum]